MSFRRQLPYILGLILWVVFLGTSLFAFNWYLDLPMIVILLSSLNVASFALYGFDKLLAQQQQLRIPERILYLAAFIGGPIGALGGMYFFRHKTAKLSFQFALALTILVEVLIMLAVLQIKK